MNGSLNYYDLASLAEAAYSSFTNFSRDGVKESLKNEKFSDTQAEFFVTNCNILFIANIGFYMIGLIMLVVAFFYIGWWIAITYFSYVGVKKLTHSKGAAITVSTLFFMVMYLIPFWDWIPTVLAHKHYCAAEAGLKIYKTPEQWDEENPGILDTLVPSEKVEYFISPFGRAEKINNRFGRVFKIEEVPYLLIKKESTIYFDLIVDEPVFSYIDFSRGGGQLMSGGKGYWKFWLNKSYCNSYEKHIAVISGVRNISYGFKEKKD